MPQKRFFLRFKRTKFNFETPLGKLRKRSPPYYLFWSRGGEGQKEGHGFKGEGKGKRENEGGKYSSIWGMGMCTVHRGRRLTPISSSRTVADEPGLRYPFHFVLNLWQYVICTDLGARLKLSAQ